MSKVCIELRHIKTVMRQSQDETWSYDTQAKTRYEFVETEPRQRRVHICLETSLDERDTTCIETSSLPFDDLPYDRRHYSHNK